MGDEKNMIADEDVLQHENCHRSSSDNLSIHSTDNDLDEKTKTEPIDGRRTSHVSNYDQQSLYVNCDLVKVYKIRYLLLVLFILLSLSNAFHWIEYSIIETIITHYYQVGTFWVNCTSVVYMASYIVGIIPATWILEKRGLRTCLVIGALSNAIGSWIKCLSIARSRFWVAMVGQTILAFSQLFILNIPPVLAATWFPENEVTRATGFGVFGNQVGIALGFLIPPLLMPELEGNGTQPNNSTNLTTPSPVPSTFISQKDIEQIETGFKFLFYGVAIITTIIFILISIFFESRPKHPPSKAQAYALSMSGKQSFAKSIKALMTNRNYVLLLISYGLNTGVFYALSTVLSQMITRSMGEKYMTEAGYMGLSITLSGIVGSVVCGYVLGWSKKFKLVTLVLYLFSLLGTAAFAAAIELKSIILLFVISVMLGFFMTGYLPIGFEFAAEVSFPQSEGTSAGLLNTSAQLFGIVFTFGSSEIINRFGDVYANGAYIGALVLGLLLTILVKSDLRRQNAQLRRPSMLRHRSVTSVCLTY